MRKPGVSPPPSQTPEYKASSSGMVLGDITCERVPVALSLLTFCHGRAGGEPWNEASDWFRETMRS